MSDNMIYRPDLFVKDWTGPGKWSASDRARKCAMVSCAGGWTEHPIEGARTLVAISPTYVTYDGHPAGPSMSLGLEAQRLGYDMFSCLRPGGVQMRSQRVCLWRAITYTGGIAHEQAQWALNIARPEVARWAGERHGMVLWPDGFHIDWWTTISEAFENPTLGNDSIGVLEPETFWPKYARGLDNFADAIRRGRAMNGVEETLLLLQNFHVENKNVDGAGDGLFIEQHPRRFHDAIDWPAYYLEQFAKLDDYNGNRGPAINTIEVRYPQLHAQAYINEILGYCIDNELMLSYGYEKLCGLNVPAYNPGLM